MTNNPKVPTNLIPTKITQLPLADTPTVTDSTIIVQNGITKRGTFGQADRRHRAHWPYGA